MHVYVCTLMYMQGNTNACTVFCRAVLHTLKDLEKYVEKDVSGYRSQILIGSPTLLPFSREPGPSLFISLKAYPDLWLSTMEPRL